MTDVGNGEAARAEAAQAEAARAEAARAEAAKAEAAKAEAAKAEAAKAEAAKAEAPKAEAAKAEAAKAEPAKAAASKTDGTGAAAGTRRTGVLAGIALVAAAVGGAGGYGISAQGTSSVKIQLDQSLKDLAQAKAAFATWQTDKAKINSDLAAAKQEVAALQAQLEGQRGDLQKSVDQLTKNLQKVTADRNRNAKQASDLQASLTTTQQNLREAEDALPRKVKQLETITTQRIQLLTNQLRESQNEVAVLTKRISTPVNNRNGTLVWSGNVKGKKTIEIKNGVANIGTVTGTLPGKPHTLTPADPSKIKIRKTPAADNQWRNFSFELSGNGPTEARFYWTAQ